MNLEEIELSLSFFNIRKDNQDLYKEIAVFKHSLTVLTNFAVYDFAISDPVKNGKFTKIEDAFSRHDHFNYTN